jgi:hypothetical protein
MPNLVTTTKPGKKERSLRKPRVYEALRKQGYSKEAAARISNAQARKKSSTLDQLESFVSSSHYDPQTASLIALGIPELPRFKGEQIAPGITRIRGNLCNVHGKYGPCDKGLSGKKKPKGRAARKPAKTDAQRAAERQQRQAERQQETTRQQALNMTKVGEATGLDDHLANLDQFAQGKPLRPQDEDTLIARGLLERGADGTVRKTAQANVLLNAAKRGDVQGAKDAASRARDQHGKQQDLAKRQQDAAGKRTAAQADRELRKREREQAQAKRADERARGASGGKKPEKEAQEKPLKVRPTKRVARSSAPSVGGVAGAAANKKPSPAAPEQAPAKQIAPQLAESAQALSDGKELSEQDTQALIRNGLARLVKGELVLTAAGQRATLKSFRVFKDASGHYRWVAQSSTAYQDRDKEIVSTKALADDCAFADQTGSYGPLRWWHSPGLDLGECDFNAMHGRVLIESGTFKSEPIAMKVAAAAPQLEISLGFLHLPTEPDANGVFHHIRRFERSLVPRGKASNRFTAFTVKEIPMLDATKVAALKTLGFSDDDITNLQSQAEATEKAAADQGVAYKADEPEAVELPDLVINGVTYKALPPSPPTAEDAVVEEDAIEPMVDEPVDDTALTLSSGDLSAIAEAVATALQAGIAQVMGALDLEKKVAGHVQSFMQPYTAQKDATDAEKAEQIAQLQASLKQAQEQTAATEAKLNELLGYQPAVKAERASESITTITNPWLPTDQQLLAAVKHQVDPNQQFAFGDLVTNLFGDSTPG